MIQMKGGEGMVYDAALFDLDGTLIVSKGVWTRIDEEFLARRGIVTPDDSKRAVSSGEVQRGGGLHDRALRPERHGRGAVG